MNNIIVNTQITDSVAEQIGTISNRVEGQSDRLASVVNGLSRTDSMDVCRRMILSEAETIKRISNYLMVYSSSLRRISNLYNQTERKIAGIADERTSANTRKATAGTARGSASGNRSNTTSDDQGGFSSSSGRNYTYGPATQPTWEPGNPYDHDYDYDPDAKPTLDDYKNWAKYGILDWGANTLDYIPDATEAYEHYRDGNGEDLHIDFAKAYQQDPAIKQDVDAVIAQTQRDVEEMIASGKQPPFSISSGLIACDTYPKTENWQKAIGAYNMWVSAEVTLDANGNICMKTVVHEIDRYNFNAGMHDIASGLKDQENGRFEQLGWAHSFNTVGEAKFDVTWEPGNINATDSTITNSSRPIRNTIEADRDEKIGDMVDKVKDRI